MTFLVMLHDELLLSGNSSAAEENNESSNDRLFDSDVSLNDFCLFN